MNYVLTPTAVRKLRRVLAPTPGNTGAGGAPTTIRPDDFPPPFTVRWSQSQSQGQGAWVIWLPDISQLVMYDTDYVTPSGVSAASALPSGWYTIDDVENDDEEVWLVLHTPGDPQSTTPVSAELTNAEGQATTGESVTNLLIAQMDTDETTGARRVKQFVDSAVVVGAGGITPDNISTEIIPEPEEGEEPTGGEGKLQIFDFDSKESDSPEGFVERLKADTETGDIKVQSGTNIMLLARRNGKMVYIPLTAGGTDPEDEKPYDPENDPCAHPGDNAPGAETHSESSGGGGGVDVGAGGVPAGGDIHTGDDDCNCERI